MKVEETSGKEKTVYSCPMHPEVKSVALAKALPAMAWRVSVPWNLLLSTAPGLWLMFAPYALSFEGSLADSDHLVGALVVTFSVIAMAEVTRYIRFIN